MHTKFTVSDGHPTAVALSPSDSIALTMTNFNHFKNSNDGKRVLNDPFSLYVLLAVLTAILDAHVTRDWGREREKAGNELITTWRANMAYKIVFSTWRL